MGKNYWPGKKSMGAVIGVIVVVALMYVYNMRSVKTAPHAMPRVGRGYGSTPYGQPAGNPGTLRSLGSRSQQGAGCGCHEGGIHV